MGGFGQLGCRKRNVFRRSWNKSGMDTVLEHDTESSTDYVHHSSCCKNESIESNTSSIIHDSGSPDRAVGSLALVWCTHVLVQPLYWGSICIRESIGLSRAKTHDRLFHHSAQSTVKEESLGLIRIIPSIFEDIQKFPLWSWCFGDQEVLTSFYNTIILRFQQPKAKIGFRSREELLFIPPSV